MIVGAKSLELHSRNHEPPETLLVLTPRVNRVVTLSRGRTIVFQSVHEAAPKWAFHTCYSFSETLTIEGIWFRVCSREQALLETLTKRKGSQEVDVYLVERFLWRYAKYLRDSVVYDLVRIRYITAINRLRVITKKMWLNDVYSMCLVAIKRYGNGCFVSVDV